MKATHNFLGYKLTLDSSEINHADPGAGTPAMVSKGAACCTYHCATGAGELDDGTEIPASVIAWLEGFEDVINAMWEAQA